MANAATKFPGERIRIGLSPQQGKQSKGARHVLRDDVVPIVGARAAVVAGAFVPGISGDSSGHSSVGCGWIAFAGCRGDAPCAIRPAMPHYIFESRLLKTMSGPICGVDEAGRGPLAGPVVAAAVILERKRIPKGLNDSKQLSPENREELFPRILEMALAVGVGEAGVDEIDLVNIRQATHLAMARAVRALVAAPMFALVDGNDAPALPCRCDTIVDGDARSVSIAAASIVAKVTRDRMMVALHEQHPGYGWFTNKGYSTEEHLEALNRLGPCLHHRRSFAPVYRLLHPEAPETVLASLVQPEPAAEAA